MTLELTKEEVVILHDLIKWRIENLGPEIRHTDKLDYRHGLEQLQNQLSALNSRLERIPA